MELSPDWIHFATFYGSGLHLVVWRAGAWGDRGEPTNWAGHVRLASRSRGKFDFSPSHTAASIKRSVSLMPAAVSDGDWNARVSCWLEGCRRRDVVRTGSLCSCGANVVTPSLSGSGSNFVWLTCHVY